jgi:hypothetical protein
MKKYIFLSALVGLTASLGFCMEKRCSDAPFLPDEPGEKKRTGHHQSSSMIKDSHAYSPDKTDQNFSNYNFDTPCGNRFSLDYNGEVMFQAVVRARAQFDETMGFPGANKY